MFMNVLDKVSSDQKKVTSDDLPFKEELWKKSLI